MPVSCVGDHPHACAPHLDAGSCRAGGSSVTGVTPTRHPGGESCSLAGCLTAACSLVEAVMTRTPYVWLLVDPFTISGTALKCTCTCKRCDHKSRAADACAVCSGSLFAALTSCLCYCCAPLPFGCCAQVHLLDPERAGQPQRLQTEGINFAGLWAQQQLLDVDK